MCLKDWQLLSKNNEGWISEHYTQKYPSTLQRCCHQWTTDQERSMPTSWSREPRACSDHDQEACWILTKYQQRRNNSSNWRMEHLHYQNTIIEDKEYHTATILLNDIFIKGKVCKKDLIPETNPLDMKAYVKNTDLPEYLGDYWVAVYIKWQPSCLLWFIWSVNRQKLYYIIRRKQFNWIDW